MCAVLPRAGDCKEVVGGQLVLKCDEQQGSRAVILERPLRAVVSIELDGGLQAPGKCIRIAFDKVASCRLSP